MNITEQTIQRLLKQTHDNIVEINQRDWPEFMKTQSIKLIEDSTHAEVQRIWKRSLPSSRKVS